MCFVNVQVPCIHFHIYVKVWYKTCNPDFYGFYTEIYLFCELRLKYYFWYQYVKHDIYIMIAIVGGYVGQ